jgi:hypothetical protein
MSDERIITNAMIREQDQERIAQLEGLLREALSCIHYARRAQGLDKPEIEQRIEAALGGK